MMEHNRIKITPHKVGIDYIITAVPHVKGYVVQHYIFEIEKGTKTVSRWQLNALEFEANRSNAYFVSGDSWHLDRLKQLVEHFEACFRIYHDYEPREEFAEWHLKRLDIEDAL